MSRHQKNTTRIYAITISTLFAFLLTGLWLGSRPIQAALMAQGGGTPGPFSETFDGHIPVR